MHVLVYFSTADALVLVLNTLYFYFSKSLLAFSDQSLGAMARTLKGADHRRGKIEEFLTMVCLPDRIDRFTYKGYPCPKGHMLRHRHHHWCVQCVSNIVNNKCGMDVNLTDISHASFYSHFFQCVQPPRGFDECWLMSEDFLAIKDRNYPRLTALTYRTGLAGVSNTISLTKFVYNYFWGDVGALVVTRTCKNPACWNPLHMKSCFNMAKSPTSVDPLQLKYDSVKNMLNHMKPRSFESEKVLSPDLAARLAGL